MVASAVTKSPTAALPRRSPVVLGIVKGHSLQRDLAPADRQETRLRAILGVRIRTRGCGGSTPGPLAFARPVAAKKSRKKIGRRRPLWDEGALFLAARPYVPA